PGIAAAARVPDPPSTGACPYWSASRPNTGAATDENSQNVADTAPASVYDPPVRVISRTQPRPIMANGSRITNPAAVNAGAPGMANNRRDAVSTPPPEPGN